MDFLDWVVFFAVVVVAVVVVAAVILAVESTKLDSIANSFCVMKGYQGGEYSHDLEKVICQTYEYFPAQEAGIKP